MTTFRSRSGYTIAAVMVAAAVLATFGPALWNRLFPKSGMDVLVEASEERAFRTIEARLSGGFPFRPFKGPTRGVRDAEEWRLLQALVLVDPKVPGTLSSRDLHVRGASRLLLGHLDDAIATMQEALIADATAQDFIEALSKSRNAAFLTDVAAAFHSRGRQRVMAEDFIVALDAAERAWVIGKTPETAWNRALAIESLHDHADALAAWNDYLGIDSGSQWADQVRERLKQLRKPTQSQLWETAKPIIRSAALTSDQKKVESFVHRFPQQSRAWGEDELLYEWATATTRGDVRSAEHSLVLAEAIGAALQQVTGEATLREAVLAIRRSGAALAKAHLEYHDASVFDRELRTKEATVAWRVAADSLRNHSSPLSIRATTFGATATYLLGNGVTAVTLIDPFIENHELRLRYPSAVAQAYWLRGLIRCSSGQLAEGINDYRDALVLFERVGESDNIAGVHTRLAANLSYIGQPEEAWRHRAAAFRILDLYGRSSRMQPLLVDTARAVERRGYLVAALRFHDRLVASAVDDPVWRVESLRGRSIARWKAGRSEEAMSDLRLAMTEALRLPDASRRERAIANVRSAESTLVREAEPGRAIDAATEAIAFYQRVINRMRLADLYVERALAHERRGDFAPATGDLETAASVLEEQRRNLRTPADRQSFLERRRALFETGVKLFVARKEFDDALMFGEAARARTLLDAMSQNRGVEPLRMSATDLGARVPNGSTLLWYAALPDRLVTCAIRRGSIVGVAQPISSRRLEHLVHRYTQVCSTSDVEAPCHESSAALYDILIRPIAAHLEMKIAVVPDGILHAIPFPALFDASRGRYLIEDHEVVFAPSAATFLEHQTRPQSPVQEVVLIGNPAFDAALHPGLPVLLSAESEVQRLDQLYPAARLFTGRQANKSVLLDAAGRGALIHFAGHVIFDPADTTRSALVLAPARPGDDGRLSAAEILRTSMSKVPLIVLSACGTWKRSDPGGSAMGFAEVFLRAGAHTVMASLTPVEDTSTSRFIIAFHEAFQERGDAVAALRDAQLRFIHDPDRQLHFPTAWSNFIVIV